MARPHFLHLTTATATAALLAACGPRPSEDAPATAEDILAAVGLTTPPLDTAVADGTVKGDEPWSKVVNFSGPADSVEAWIAEGVEDAVGFLVVVGHEAEPAVYVAVWHAGR